jgi:hypothetical protein
MEAILTVISGKKASEMTEEDYGKLIDEIGFTPRIENLNRCEEIAVE